MRHLSPILFKGGGGESVCTQRSKRAVNIELKLLLLVIFEQLLIPRVVEDLNTLFLATTRLDNGDWIGVMTKCTMRAVLGKLSPF